MKGLPASLELRNLNGTKVYGIAGTDWNLVKKNEEGEFEPYASIDGYVTESEMEEQFGIWEDKEVTKGVLMWKKTVREQDGKVQADEVDGLPEFSYYQTATRLARGQGMSADRRYQMTGASIVVEDFANNKAVFQSEWSKRVGSWGIYDSTHPLAPAEAQDKP